MASYNSLLDPHLSAFFSSTRVRKHLRKAGLVSGVLSWLAALKIIVKFRLRSHHYDNIMK